MLVKFNSHTMHVFFQSELTSICICELSSPKEAQVACSGPDGLGISKTQPGIEMIRLERLISINGKIATGIVGTVDPYLWTERNIIVQKPLCAPSLLQGREVNCLYKSTSYFSQWPRFPWISLIQGNGGFA